MVTKAVLKRKKIAILVVTIALISTVSLCVMLVNDFVPEELTRITKHTEEVNRVKEIQKNFAVAVYYPKQNEVVDKIIEDKANELLNGIVADKASLIEEFTSVMVRVDYSLENYSNSVMQIKFNIDYIGKDKRSINTVVPYLIDRDSGLLVDTTQIFDDTAMRVLRQNLRNSTKQDESTKEIGFSRDFLEKSASSSELFSKFYLEGNELVFIIEGFGEEIFFRQNIETIASHINIDLGFEQTEADPVIYIPTRYIDPNRPMIAITFDDGPHVEYTPEILNVLRQYDSAATFFILGNRIGKNSRNTVIETIESGSEIASHSWSHPNLTRTKELNEQFNATSVKVYEDVSQWCYQIKLYRPPYGAVSKRVSESSPYPFIMWNVDTMDWKTRNTQATVDSVLKEASDGDIMLMHDIHFESKEAAKEIIPLLIDKGYQLVTVSEMMNSKGITLENGKQYYRAK